MGFSKHELLTLYFKNLQCGLFGSYANTQAPVTS